MPMLADLDDPPRSRARDLIFGVLVGLPIVALVAWLVVPWIAGMVMGNASSYDQRLRAEDAYMKTLCSELMVLPRDEELCKCVLAIEVPSLDCRIPFLAWSLERHHEACADRDRRRASLTFCSCIDTMRERIEKAKAESAEAARVETQRVGKCLELDDAFPLPELADLAGAAPAAAPSEEAAQPATP
ncbi:MAG TPA: hypothetical protein VIK91_19985 [Nannocystis sp.]